VVDNGSRDHTTAEVARWSPGARLVRNRENRGVAPARNQGLALARAPYAILLDVDTVATPGSLVRLLAHLEGAPSVGLCGPRLMLPDGEIQPSCQRFPTVMDKLARQVPGDVGRRLRRDVELADFDHRSVREVDYVVGACQAIRMKALAQVGWLDERIFYGPEDVDLCLRMRLAGWQVTYVGDAIVRHECQRITRRRPSALTWHHLRGLAHFYRTHGYLWSRRPLYARIASRDEARRADPVPEGTPCTSTP
jgi:GT2 family glycosyltransferase